MPPSAPAQAGAAAAAAALANLNVHVSPLGDWTTQASDPSLLCEALGGRTLRQKVGEGDAEAQYSRGYFLMQEACGDGDACQKLDWTVGGHKETCGTFH